VKVDTGGIGAEGRRFEYAEENGENIIINTIARRYTNITGTYQRPAFAVYCTVEVRMYPHVFGRLCTPTEQTVRKKPRTQNYANKGSMATARKKS